MIVRFKNNIGMVKQSKVGFSWTTFFFGFFPALFRGDFKYFLIQLLLAPLTLGFSSLVFMFIYNKLYIKDLLANGYEPYGESDKDILIMNGFLSVDTNKEG
ncbi:MAG: HrgC protein [Cetobacterium sp.]